ncbi:6-phospho-3-hexuloisomerase [Anaerobium acetethylicum]|uniref:6-phospho-3-hexuloisomerase n=1 Tax=Anaerobium acetethylicum TaxID=1619234 RepID=A0A1D3TWL2_9FIRM|nr:6-phospho-3-hexuloisomerase [Anaerobium acetethylicum]SCP98616.1 6-phospho-3-hexuloisomerase [Anaerobium acetethylicum]
MTYGEYREKILKEISDCAKSIVSDNKINDFVNTIVNSKSVFCDGKGRSGLQAKAFAMRLSQMGITAYETSAATTPAIEERDLLIICTGSGETPNLIEHACRAHELGVKIVAITGIAESTISKLSDIVFIIDAKPKASQSNVSIQPMGTLFEQVVEVFFDTMVLMLMEKLQISNDDMYAKHNNLE